MSPAEIEANKHQHGLLARAVIDAQHTRDGQVQMVAQIKASIEDLTARLPIAEAELDAAEQLVQERHAELHRWRAEQSQEHRLQAAREAREEVWRRAQEEEARAAQAVVAATERQIEATNRLAILAGPKQGE